MAMYPKIEHKLDLTQFKQVKEFGEYKVGDKVKVKKSALEHYCWPTFPEFFDLLEIWINTSGSVTMTLGDPNRTDTPMFSVFTFNMTHLVSTGKN